MWQVEKKKQHGAQKQDLIQVPVPPLSSGVTLNNSVQLSGTWVFSE